MLRSSVAVRVCYPLARFTKETMFSAAQKHFPPRQRRSQGFTLIELLVVIAIVSVLMSIAVLLKASFVETRSQAMSTSSVRRVTLSQGALVYDRNTSCGTAAGWKSLNAPQLPDGVVLSGISGWSICFTSRGTLAQSPDSTLNITDARGRSKTLTLYLTGSVVSE